MKPILHTLKRFFIHPFKAGKEISLLQKKVEELEQKEIQLQTLNVNLVNNFRQKEIRLTKEYEKNLNQEVIKKNVLEKEITRLKWEIASLIQTDRKSQQRIAILQSLVDNQKHQIQDLEDKIRRIPFKFTDSKQVKKLRNNIQEKEIEIEFLKRRIEEKNELIRTLTDQLLSFKQNQSQTSE